MYLHPLKSNSDLHPPKSNSQVLTIKLLEFVKSGYPKTLYTCYQIPGV